MASQEDLQKADIWSLGLLVYLLINPNLTNPYRGEFEQAGIPFTQNAMKDLLRRKQLPSHDSKYADLRKSTWWQLEDVFKSCARFDPKSRPTAAEALRLLDNSDINRGPNRLTLRTCEGYGGCPFSANFSLTIVVKLRFR